jgi:hypothetical protein
MNQGIYGLGQNTIANLPYGVNGITVPTTIRVLVVGGGGAGGLSGTRPAGGGGGGGVVEQTLGIVLGTSYTISIGAGGAVNGNASFSRFSSIVAMPGGAGNNTTSYGVQLAGTCATGAGVTTAASVNRAVSLCSIQGFNGGLGNINNTAGGGGGAGAVGEDKTTGTVSGAGGAGRTSTIPVAATTYGGGGGGGGKAAATATTPGAGGSGGGGAGSNGTTAATSGTANTGGGGGGGSTESAGTAGTGGSGVVVLRFNNALLFTAGTGLTYTSEISGSDRVLTFTAGTGTITFY